MALRCDCCGRFIAYAELDENGGASSIFVPDSPFGHEENAFHCARCTAAHGGPIPRQAGVDLNVVTRRY